MSLPQRVKTKYYEGITNALDEDVESWHRSLMALKAHVTNVYPSGLCVLHNVWGQFKRYTIATPEDVDLVILQPDTYINKRISEKVNYVIVDSFDVDSVEFCDLLQRVKGKRVRLDARKKIPLISIERLSSMCSNIELCIGNLDTLDTIIHNNPVNLLTDTIYDNVSLIKTRYGMLMSVIKPSNLQSVPGPKDKDSIETRYKGWTPVHRLDYASSGLLVLSQNNTPVASIIKYLFAAEMTLKKYKVRLTRPLKSKRVVSIGIEPSSDVSRMIITNENKVNTTFEPVSILEDNTTIAVATIITGKRHQIRLSALAMDNSLVGDKQYLQSSNKFYKYDMLLECFFIMFDMSSVSEDNIVFEVV